MMIRVCPKRFPSGIVKKLHAGRTGNYRVMRKIGSNV